MSRCTLVVESGSTKTEWAVLAENGYHIYRTSGINPASNKEFPEIFTESNELAELAHTIDKIFYYGSGVIDPHTVTTIKQWLILKFPSAVSEVENDLLAACRSTAKTNASIVSILGTGSNSCLYDGTTIVDNIPSLGYAISNEGGGTDIGKAILQAYFYRKMPEKVKTKFDAQYAINKSQVIYDLYQKPNPAAALAFYASFINNCEDDTWRRSVLTTCFKSFVESRILTYKEYHRYELHFVGSIAYFCQDILKEVLEHYNLQAQSIVQKPINGLINWHNKA